MYIVVVPAEFSVPVLQRGRCFHGPAQCLVKKRPPVFQFLVPVWIVHGNDSKFFFPLLRSLPLKRFKILPFHSGFQVVQCPGCIYGRKSHTYFKHSVVHVLLLSLDKIKYKY